MFNTWMETAEQKAAASLKKPILTQDLRHVNFSTELDLIIRETKSLDRMGFQLPELVLNIALQDAKFKQYVDSLMVTLSSFRTATESLSPADAVLMSSHIAGVENELRHGYDVLNWSCLAIPKFVENMTQKIIVLQSTIGQVQKNASMIQSMIDSISSAVLIPLPSDDTHNLDTHTLPDLVEFYDDTRKEMLKVAEALVGRYKTIGPVLAKIEGLVFGTDTRRAPQMASYYAYWERKIFNALNQMVLRAMLNLQLILHVHPSTSRQYAPLFQITASLVSPDIVLSPSMTDVHRLLGRLVVSVVEVSKMFVRWMNGTCIPVNSRLVRLKAGANATPSVVPASGAQSTTVSHLSVVKGSTVKSSMTSMQSESHGQDNELVRTASRSNVTDESLQLFTFYADISGNPQGMCKFAVVVTM